MSRAYKKKIFFNSQAYDKLASSIYNKRNKNLNCSEIPTSHLSDLKNPKVVIFCKTIVLYYNQGTTYMLSC